MPPIKNFSFCKYIVLQVLRALSNAFNVNAINILNINYTTVLSDSTEFNSIISLRYFNLIPVFLDKAIE